MIPISAPAIATINTSRMGQHPSVCAPNPLRLHALPLARPAVACRAEL